jgi:hypothetical protein
VTVEFGVGALTESGEGQLAAFIEKLLAK